MKQIYDKRFGYTLALVLAAFMALGFLPGGFDFSQSPPGSEEVDESAVVEGSILRRVQYMPLLLLSFYVAWRRRTVAVQFLKDVNPMVLAFTAFAALSLLWSPEPGISLRRLVLVLGNLGAAFAFQLACWYPSRFARVSCWIFAGLMLAALFAVLFIPSVGLTTYAPHAGSWRGITSHKNQAGMLAAIGFIFWSHAYFAGHYRKWVCLAFAGLALLLIVMARSSTSLLAALICLVVIWWAVKPVLAVANWMLVTIMTGIALVGGLVFVFFVTTGKLPTMQTVVGPIAQAFGKDPSLTGRDVIWADIWSYYIQNPWLGRGFESFWLGATGPSGELGEAYYWRPNQSHNGYLDILNETGAVGLTLLVLFLLVYLWRMLQFYRLDARQASLHLAIFMFVFIHNWTESSLFRASHPAFLLLLFSSFTVDRALSPVMQRLDYRQRYSAWLKRRQSRRQSTGPDTLTASASAGRSISRHAR